MKENSREKSNLAKRRKGATRRKKIFGGGENKSSLKGWDGIGAGSSMGVNRWESKPKAIYLLNCPRDLGSRKTKRDKKRGYYQLRLENNMLQAMVIKGQKEEEAGGLNERRRTSASGRGRGRSGGGKKAANLYDKKRREKND